MLYSNIVFNFLYVENQDELKEESKVLRNKIGSESGI